MGRGSEDGSGVVERDGPVPWAALDAAGEPVGVVGAYLAELAASDCSALTIRAYAYDLLAWWRFLTVRGVAWDEVGRVDVRDYVLELRGRDHPYRHRRSDSVPAGVVNARTGKASLAGGYAPATINRRLTVIRLSTRNTKLEVSGTLGLPLRGCPALRVDAVQTRRRGAPLPGGPTGLRRLGCRCPLPVVAFPAENVTAEPVTWWHVHPCRDPARRAGPRGPSVGRPDPLPATAGAPRRSRVPE